MNTRPPKLRQHHKGLYFVHWGGHDYFLGRDKAIAEVRYLEQIRQWAQWREGRDARRLLPPSQAVMTIELAERFLEHQELENGDGAVKYYRKHLKRFLHFFGKIRADVVRVRHLQDLKDRMLQDRYAPKTINHDLGAVRGLFNWATGLELIPAVTFRGCKNLPLGPPPDKALSRESARDMITSALDPVRPWLAVNYFALLRASEVVKCVQKEGRWAEKGVFVLDRGKMDRRARLRRHCLFSDHALMWLARCEPVWNRLDCYSSAVRRQLGNGGPGVLRHSGASHLSLAGVSSVDIEHILGHVPSRLTLTYHRPSWQRLRHLAGLLARRSADRDTALG